MHEKDLITGIDTNNVKPDQVFFSGMNGVKQKIKPPNEQTNKQGDTKKISARYCTFIIFLH